MKKVMNKVFSPHEEHNPRPLFWHPLCVSLFAVGALFISGFLTIEKLETNNPNLLGDIKSGALIAFTNTERSKAGITALEENETLNEAAQLKANDMAANGYFAHYTPSGLSPWYWFTQAGYAYQKAGENLAVNFNDSKDVVNAWMNSPTHKANIVKDGYTQIGIATAEGMYKGKKATFVVQLFGTPVVDTTSQLALVVEKKSPVIPTSQSSVRGAEVSVITLATASQLFTTQTYALVITLTLISLIIAIALLIVLIKGKRHTKQFYISIIILTLALILSIYTEISFFKDITFSVTS